METDFKLTGLSKPQSFTCEPLNNDTIFLAKNGLGKENLKELCTKCNIPFEGKTKERMATLLKNRIDLNKRIQLKINLNNE